MDTVKEAVAIFIFYFSRGPELHGKYRMWSTYIFIVNPCEKIFF